MKKAIITVLLVLLVGVVSIGFYRSWFALSSSNPDSQSDKVNVNLTMDQGKMQEDALAVKNRVAELTGKATAEVKGSGDPTTDKVKSHDP